jgi:hypothetical protein
MERAPGPLVITRWTRQDRRAPAALAPGYAKLDGRSLPDLLSEAAHFARHVRFFDGAGAEEGDWGDMLEADPAVFLSLVATFRFEDEAEALRRQLRRLRGDGDHEARERALRAVETLILHLARAADRWIGASTADAEAGRGAAAAEMVRAALEEWLAPPLRRLVGLFSAIESGGFVEGRFAVLVYPFDPGWRVSEADSVALAWEIEELWLDLVAEPLTDAAEAFLSGLAKLKAAAGEALESRIEDGGHAPHIGLLRAFLKLFGHEQDRLNAILPRLARYYHEVQVGAAPRPARADRVFLAFTRAASESPPPRIAAGHVFEAKAAAAPRFAADFALAVTGTNVEELRIWQVGAAPRRVGFQATAPIEENAIAEAFAAARASLPPAPAGLIVAGGAMRAPSGMRRFELTLDLAGIDWPETADEADFAPLLGLAFGLSVFTEEGWVDVEGASAQGALGGGGQASATFRFALPPDSPALADAAPAVRLLLRQDGLPGPLAPLAIFGEARVLRVVVELAVEDLGGLALTTNAGEAVSATGLAPFGTPAVRGGWLEVRHPVLDRGVEQVALSLRWAEPPPHADGFYGYYREYVVDLDRTVSRRGVPLFRNDVFRVSIGEAGGEGGAGEDLPLFPQAEPRGPVGPVTSLAVNPPAGTGGIRLTLTGPDYAFGDLIYQSNVLFATEVAAGRAKYRRRRHPIMVWLDQLAARLKRFGKALNRLRKHAWEQFFLVEYAPSGEEEAASPRRPAPLVLPRVAGLMPNPPWRAVLAGLRLDYRARFATDEDGESGDVDLGHWLPIGEAVPAAWAEGVRLLPELPAQTCFDLRLSLSAGGEAVTLLFLLDAESETPPVAWLEQPADEAPWRPAEVLDDRTHGLTRSGLLRLAAAPRRLRAVSSGPLPRVEAVIPDALSATRILSGPDDPVEPVPAGAIAKVSGVKGIGAVRQPLGAFGGSAGGGAEALAIRAGERLRHKQRAILAWDDERLVLDRFPEIDRVRVLPARGRDGRPRPGSVLAVVVPAAEAGTPTGARLPAAPAPLLREVEGELAARAPMSASVVAVSPVFARVAIRVKVALAASGDGARLEGDIRNFFSPWAEDGPDLPDHAGTDDLAASLLRFLRGLPYLLAVADCEVEFAQEAHSAPWIVPVAGETEIEVLTLESFGA